MTGPESNSIGETVRARRVALGMSQQALARAIGHGQSYITKIENGTNKALQVELRLRLAHALEMSPETLGVANTSTDAGPLTGEEARSQLRVASIAREAGYPAEAAAAATAVIRHLPEEDLSADLASARASALLVAAVALGDIYDARQHHPGIALLTQAHTLAVATEQQALEHSITLKLGNELRKAGDPTAAEAWLERAVASAPSLQATQAARVALLRVLGEVRDRSRSSREVNELRRVEDHPEIWTPTLHPLCAAEAEARHLLSFGRAVRSDIKQRLQSHPTYAVAPQWRVISQITLAESLMANRDDDQAVAILTGVLSLARELDALPRLRERAGLLLTRNRAADPSLVAHLTESQAHPRPSTDE